MSNISTAFDAVLTALATLFPDKTRIPNAYFLPSNKTVFMTDGYGLKIGVANPAIHQFNNFSRTREFTIILTKEMLRLDSDKTPFDTVTKSLLEDVYKLQKDFLNNDQLDAEASIELINLFSSSPVDGFLVNEKTNFLTIDVTFGIQITDDLE